MKPAANASSAKMKAEPSSRPLKNCFAMMAANEEHYAEALLSFMNFIVIAPTDENASHVAYTMDQISSGNFNVEPKGIKIDETDPFEVVNLMIKNKVALDKNYKVKTTIKTNYAKQIHFILSNMKYDAIVGSGIPILERVPIPDGMLPPDSQVEIDAKIAAGYFSHSSAPVDLNTTKGRTWDDINH